MKSSCKVVWTPIIDEEVEGEFRSSTTGQLATYQPWLGDQPSGGDTENHVAIHVKSKLWMDTPKMEEYCSACDLPKTLVFSLIGICKHTYFGKKLGYWNYTKFANLKFMGTTYFQLSKLNFPLSASPLVEKIETNKSLAAPGALTHRLQLRTTCKIQNGRQGAPKMPDGVWKDVYP